MNLRVLVALLLLMVLVPMFAALAMGVDGAEISVNTTAQGCTRAISR
jgi:hypothetical protein